MTDDRPVVSRRSSSLGSGTDAAKEAAFQGALDDLHHQLEAEKNAEDLGENVCPGCGATDCTPATCLAYVGWKSE